MKEVQNIIEWVDTHIAWVKSLNGPEVECGTLVEWLELEERAALRRGGIVLARIVTGLCGFVGVALLIALAWTALRWPYSPGREAIAFTSMLVGGAVGSALLVRFAFGAKGRSPSRSHREADAMSAIAHLRNVHGYRGLRKELGEHGVMELNEGAQLYMRCRSILTAAPWVSESTDDPWAEARNDLLRAMESAMDRLTLYVVKKRPFSDIAPVLDEMRIAANEVASITEQRSAVGSGAGRDLRASLARMKELAAAEDELMRVQE